MLHFNDEGEIYPGWNVHGEVLWDGSEETVTNQIVSQADSSLIILGSQMVNETLGLIGSGNAIIMMQHVSEDGQPDAITDRSQVVSSFKLNDIYPNPLNSQLTVKFSTDRAAGLTLTVRDLMGRSIHKNTLASTTGGHHSHILDASAWGSGIYLVSINSGIKTITTKAVLLR